MLDLWIYGFMSHSHSSSLWHIPTLWEYDWWEFDQIDDDFYHDHDDKNYDDGWRWSERYLEHKTLISHDHPFSYVLFQLLALHMMVKMMIVKKEDIGEGWC